VAARRGADVGFFERWVERHIEEAASLRKAVVLEEFGQTAGLTDADKVRAGLPRARAPQLLLA